MVFSLPRVSFARRSGQLVYQHLNKALAGSKCRMPVRKWNIFVAISSSNVQYVLKDKQIFKSPP